MMVEVGAYFPLVLMFKLKTTILTADFHSRQTLSMKTNDIQSSPLTSTPGKNHEISTLKNVHLIFLV